MGGVPLCHGNSACVGLPPLHVVIGAFGACAWAGRIWNLLHMARAQKAESLSTPGQQRPAPTGVETQRKRSRVKTWAEGPEVSRAWGVTRRGPQRTTVGPLKLELVD
ncbi:hypothetical protein NDU88_008188 [Pleurodeles waltl]|uniref:Uncharacterized protein n=1 Tax=Pleurodeles waltl TaxID=8319 RepID=A0AAV7N6C1_PLEWA|nr:hypothetical protein NDU88_008188 [Pleurodeles waltl]